MPDAHERLRSDADGLPLAPSLSPALDSIPATPAQRGVDRSVVRIACLALLLAAVAAVIAQLLMHLVWFITGLSFHGILTFQPQTPLGNRLGPWVIAVPAIGGLIVGFMARYGSRAIRGHGIPEAMEQVITNESRIPARMTFLKPISAAIAIGTGGPFGAEGPIIATGGALGSLLGQVLRTTAVERKTLLAAGAAAGMAATFGSPVSAVLLAVELLLFEYRARSLVPVALAAATATGVRYAFEGSHAVFHMADITQPTGAALACYAFIGAIMGLLSVIVTRAVYAIEDAFEKLPVHWMWWPAIGGLAVGAVGLFFPRTLGVGYYNISDMLSGNLLLTALVTLAVWKFVSWSISLGSGTSGGTLAPLFTIGGAAGAIIGVGIENLFPAAHLDIRIAALVGMAALFAGASRALLASVVFAFETTLQPLGLLPLLGGCTASYMISSLLMRNTIMTEKIARRGVRVPDEYEPDFLDQLSVAQAASQHPVTLRADQTVEEVRAWLASAAPGSDHQGYPVLDNAGLLHSVITRRVIQDPRVEPGATLLDLARRAAVIVYHDNTLREAADHMVRHTVGRLPVIDRATGKLVGVITRSDLLTAHQRRIDESSQRRRHLQVRTTRN